MKSPLSTYRVQFHAGFTFADAQAVIPYLDALGVDHLYASSYLKARAGSRHGYDITDHNSFNPEVGDEAAFTAFVAALTARGMGHILDFVPNHMGIGKDDNLWWLDVLEWGEASVCAGWFDIQWDPPDPSLEGKVLVPFLGLPYGAVLESGALRLSFEPAIGGFAVRYFDHRFPVCPASFSAILDPVMRGVRDERPFDDLAAIEFERLTRAFALVRRRSRSLVRRQATRSFGERCKRELAVLVAADPVIGRRIDAAVEVLNGTPGEPETFRALHRLLQAQNYRLAYWRVAADEINYRRFFQINDLAGIKMELPEVFEATHGLILRLIAEGRLQGLRIDHIDGLYDPEAYLKRLQERAAAALAAGDGRRSEEAAGEGRGSRVSADDGSSPVAAAVSAQGRPVPATRADPLPAGQERPDSPVAPSFYIVVEKILAAHERLRADWPIAGTTGYDFLNQLNAVFVDAGGAVNLERAWRRFTGTATDFEDILHASKLRIMDQELSGELAVLATMLDRLADSDWHSRDYTRKLLRDALREVIASFPVYRTYVTPETGAGPDDCRDIDWAVAQASRRSLVIDKSVFVFIRDALALDLARPGRAYSRRATGRFAMRVQQYTAPVMAKGVEDTAFYRYHRLVSLNEVGGDPRRVGVSVATFHRAMADRATQWPRAMLATATHDTKRGEDVRARINVLSERPLEWWRRARRWQALNGYRKATIDDRPVPAAEDEYLLYQMMIGTWPLALLDDAGRDPQVLDEYRVRLRDFTVKALREAKVTSSWDAPATDYEEAACAFIDRILDPSHRNPFLTEFVRFQGQIARAAMVGGLAQTAVKLCAPGVPDLYQGAELWDFAMVDPDNRRPVDFNHRQSLLAGLATRFGTVDAETPLHVRALLDRWVDGSPKLYLIWRLLHLRRSLAGLFRDGGYVGLTVQGPAADNVLAFARVPSAARGVAGVPGRMVVVVVPRLVARMCGVTAGADTWPLGPSCWHDTAVVLPEGAPTSWTNVLTGERVEARAAVGPADEAAGDIGPGALSVAHLLTVFPVSVVVGE